MSELNKMLSDLASPNHNESTLSVAPTPTAWRFRVARLALILSVITICLSGVVWALSSHFSQDKPEHTSVVSANHPELNVVESAVSDPALSTSTVITPSLQATQKVSATQNLPLTQKLPPTQKVVSHDNDYVVRSQPTKSKPTVVKPEPESTPVARHIETVEVQKQLAASDVVVVTPVPKAQHAAVVAPKVTPSKAPARVTETDDTSSLTVETVELSGPELAAIAYEKAQKRAQIGDSKQAIAYLKDAVNYHPNHITAINQLAGLLYGRHQVRDAENVLRAGIKANPNSSSLKMTLAKMYQQNNRDESALNVLLSPVSGQSVDDIRMVSMRAGLAQKLGNHSEAQHSYHWLTQVEPEQGRWWLGAGVSSERNGDFEHAKKSYGNAIDAGGLSNQSMQFARQRLVYLNSAKGADNGH
ncbi:tetratricopeptide repeat protein [Enterovibrio nigricans]|uniref:MSHA biogenesis protein MshN n=1 Tax=Enterovibrio nigricans DSM 22720 TaxID=1121868 RepID=A0A1T4TVZ1_9GAMM|nr:tetratricopeptide repeat protein [Enterovibrio nigricans]PKF50813.1 MSHA biogenesis protein MshN [Enterovibrio nigricans]SKA44603.1 MSHA biogenesis protein MshN [Enterovibrio nigricans DSM 22720]